MPGIKCGPDETTWSRTLGQEEELALAPSAYGFNVGAFRKKHTHEETIAYKIGPGASTSPVWCHDDSELHVYEAASYLSEHLFRRRSKVFVPADPGFFAANYLNPDPACEWEGHKAGAAPDDQTLDSQRVPGSISPQMIQLVEPVSFRQVEGLGGGSDPMTDAAAAAQVLAEDLVAAIEPDGPEREDWYRPGLVGLGSAVTWLDGRTGDGSAHLVPASAGCLARDREGLSLAPHERSRPFPVLAFAGATDAKRAELTVLAKGTDGTGEFRSDEAVVREDGFELGGVPGTTVLTTVWGYADLSWLPDGVSGSIVCRAYDSDDTVVGVLELPFSTEEKPEHVPVRVEEVERVI